MKNWKHLAFEQRKVISNGISHNYKLKEIAEALCYDSTSISKESKRNRENINKQLRLFFPKGKTIDTYKKQDIKNVNQTLLNRPLKSLDSYGFRSSF